eukprot:10834106-Karenia_brevis.AAC.1
MRNSWRISAFRPAPEGLDLIPGAVTKVLTRPEIVADPKNLQAIQAEGDALRAVGTWDESTV